MSYARYGPQSNVYVWLTSVGHPSDYEGVEYEWQMEGPLGFHAWTDPWEMIDHLEELRNLGYKVPQNCIDTIIDDAEELGFRP